MNFENGKMKGFVPNFLRLFLFIWNKDVLCCCLSLDMLWSRLISICWHLSRVTQSVTKKTLFCFFSFCWLTTTHCNCIDFLRSCQSWMALGHKSSCYGGCSWTIGTNQRKFAFWLQGATATFDTQKRFRNEKILSS